LTQTFASTILIRVEKRNDFKRIEDGDAQSFKEYEVNMKNNFKTSLTLLMFLVTIVFSACSENSTIYEMPPCPTLVAEDKVVNKTSSLDFNKFDWDGAQVPSDVQKSFMNSKKIVKQLYEKRNEVSKILFEEYKTGIVFHSPKAKIPNNTQEQKLVKKLGIKELTDELFEDSNIISVQFLNNGSIDIFFKQDKKNDVIYDRSVGCGETDEIVTEYSKTRRVYGDWFYTYSCWDCYTD